MLCIHYIILNFVNYQKLTAAKEMSCVCMAKLKKRLALFYKFKLKINKSALYGIQMKYVALILGTYLQNARHRLCGRDAFGVRYSAFIFPAL